MLRGMHCSHLIKKYYSSNWLIKISCTTILAAAARPIVKEVFLLPIIKTAMRAPLHQ
jgi:hypothetical protein